MSGGLMECWVLWNKKKEKKKKKKNTKCMGQYRPTRQP